MQSLDEEWDANEDRDRPDLDMGDGLGRSNDEDEEGDDRKDEEEEGQEGGEGEGEESEHAPKDKDLDDTSSQSDGIAPPAPPPPNPSPSDQPGPPKQRRITPALQRPHLSIHPPSETSGVSMSGIKSRGNPSHGAESRTDLAHSVGSAIDEMDGIEYSATPTGDDVEPAADPMDGMESSPAPADSAKPANSQRTRSMYRTLSQSSHICPSFNSSQPFTPDPFAARAPSSDARYKEALAGLSNLAVESANKSRPDKGKSPAHAKPRGGLNVDTLLKCDRLPSSSSSSLLLIFTFSFYDKPESVVLLYLLPPVRPLFILFSFFTYHISSDSFLASGQPKAKKALHAGASRSQGTLNPRPTMAAAPLRPSDGFKTSSLSFTSSQRPGSSEHESERESDIERKRRRTRAARERAREFAAEIGDRSRRERRETVEIRGELEEERQDAIDRGRPPPVLSKGLQSLLDADPDELMGSDEEELDTDDLDLAA